MGIMEPHEGGDFAGGHADPGNDLAALIMSLLQNGSVGSGDIQIQEETPHPTRAYASTASGERLSDAFTPHDMIPTAGGVNINDLNDVNIEMRFLCNGAYRREDNGPQRGPSTGPECLRIR